MTGSSVKEIILERINQSNDNTLGPGKFFHSKLFLENLSYSDVMDIVLYYVSLQKDLDKIARISSRDFANILERATCDWMEKVETQWGKVRVPRFYGSQETYLQPRIQTIALARTPGPGPMGGTMSHAEEYEALHPGFSQHKYLLSFFRYPEGLPGRPINWPLYKKYFIEAKSFPKWRRRMHQKRLLTVLDLAESVCQLLRKFKPKE